MRVLHINCNYIGTALHQLMVEKLDRLGLQNQVFVPTYDKNLAVITPRENVLVSECFRKWDRVVFDYKQQKIRKALDSGLDVARYDLIHAYTLFTDGNCARTLSKKYGIPYVVAVRNTDVNSFFKYMVHLRSRGVAIMRDAKYVFFLSEAYRKQVFENYVPKKYHAELMPKTRIMPNGIDDFWIGNPAPAPKSLQDSKKLQLIYAGRIDKNKNIATTQKAMDLLCQRGYDVHLTVVGKPADQAVYEAVKADSRTTCLAAMPKEELIQQYRKSDLFVMPSHTETFGLVYAEAMSQGLPVIYTAGQGFDGHFPEGEVGFSVCDTDPEDVAEKILKVVENYSELSKNAISGAKRFDWDTIASQYAAMYREICP